jgi:lipid-A-disaccharide synthase
VVTSVSKSLKEATYELFDIKKEIHVIPNFIEVVKNLSTIMQNMAFCKLDIAAFEPDVLILIDYPGFNLRIAKWAASNKYKVVYYISPQVWAWKENRVKSIKKCVDQMLVILPFEKAFYQKWNYDVEYVGHPLVEVIDTYKRTHPTKKEEWKDKQIIAVLPGSRKQEILTKLPIMLEVAKLFPTYHFVVAKAPGVAEEFYQPLMANYQNVETISNRTYELLMHAKAALVTSGTATLETALFGVPEIICYKGSAISYQIAKRLITIKFIGLVNLIMDKAVVKELIQDDLTVENIAKELELILHDENKKALIQSDYQALHAMLQLGGNASANAAALICKNLQKQSFQ